MGHCYLLSSIEKIKFNVKDIFESMFFFITERKEDCYVSRETVIVLHIWIFLRWFQKSDIALPGRSQGNS